MKKVFIVLVAAAFVLGAMSISFAKQAGKAKSPVYYVCDCGPDCNCNSMSKKPGNCTCNKKMRQMHLLEIDGDTALFCTCGAGCECKINPDDKTQCGCNKPVKKVSLKGKYVCACGPDCKCGSISDKPGKCKCGSEMKLVE